MGGLAQGRAGRARRRMPALPRRRDAVLARRDSSPGVQDGPFFVYHRERRRRARGDRTSAGASTGRDRLRVRAARRRTDPGLLRAARRGPPVRALCGRATFWSRFSTIARGARSSPTGGCARRGPTGCRSWRSSTSRAAAGRCAAASSIASGPSDGVLIEEIANPRTDGVRVVRQFDADGPRCSRRPASPATTGRRAVLPRVSPTRSRAPTPTSASARSAAPTTTDRPSGRWTFLDADGEVVRTVDRGVAVRDGDEAGPLRRRCADAGGDWPARARALAADGRVREAFVAAARGAVAARRSRGVRAVARRARRRARRRNAKRNGARRWRSRRTRPSRRSSMR